MPEFIPTIRIGVVRTVKRGERERRMIVHPPIGEIVELSQEEARDLNKAHPGAVRKPVNESGAVQVSPKMTPDVPLEREDGDDDGKVNKSDGEKGGGVDGGSAADDDDL